MFLMIQIRVAEVSILDPSIQKIHKGIADNNVIQRKKKNFLGVSWEKKRRKKEDHATEPKEGVKSETRHDLKGEKLMQEKTVKP